MAVEECGGRRCSELEAGPSGTNGHATGPGLAAELDARFTP